MNEENKAFQNRADVKENLRHREVKSHLNSMNSQILSTPGEAVNVGALLLARNIKQKDIAKKYFLTPAELNRVIKGKRRTAYIRKILAIELGMDISELWNNK